MCVGDCVDCVCVEEAGDFGVWWCCVEGHGAGEVASCDDGGYTWEDSVVCFVEEVDVCVVATIKPRLIGCCDVDWNVVECRAPVCQGRVEVWMGDYDGG